MEEWTEFMKKACRREEPDVEVDPSFDGWYPDFGCCKDMNIVSHQKSFVWGVTPEAKFRVEVRWKAFLESHFPTCQNEKCQSLINLSKAP